MIFYIGQCSMKSASQGKAKTDCNEIINDVLWYNLVGSVHFFPVNKTFIVGKDKLASPKKSHKRGSSKHGGLDSWY